MRIWHLLTHTAGLTYGFQYASPVDAMYRAAGFEWGSPPGLDLAGCCDTWASLPLLFQPGTRVELLGRHRRARPGRRGGVGPVARRVLRRADLRSAWAWSTPGSWCRRRTPADWPRSTCPTRPPVRRSGRTPSGRRPLHAADCPVGRRRTGGHGGGLPPLHRDAAPGRRARRRPPARAPAPSTT